MPKSEIEKAQKRAEYWANRDREKASKRRRYLEKKAEICAKAKAQRAAQPNSIRYHERKAWREAHPDLVRQKQLQHLKDWQKRNAAKVKENNRKNWAKNKKILSQANKKYREENRESLREKSRAYYRAHKTQQITKQLPHSQLRRARKLKAPAERILKYVVFARCHGKCGICGGFPNPFDWHLDHIIPLSRGGHHTYNNVQVACPECNMWKRDKLPSELRASRL